MPKIFLGLGSNIGNREEHISKAIDYIMNISGIQFLRCSSFYETAPWGKEFQNNFINCVVEISSGIEPEELFMLFKDIEEKCGRQKREKWSEREIDIDILFYGDLVFEKDGFNIPHKEICNRNFVLIPMNELEPGLIHPVKKKKISDILSETGDKLACKKIIFNQ